MLHGRILVNPLVLLEDLPDRVVEIGALQPLLANAAVGHEVAGHHETPEQHNQDYVVNAAESRNDQHSNADLSLQIQFIASVGHMARCGYFPPAHNKNEYI